MVKVIKKHILHTIIKNVCGEYVYCGECPFYLKYKKACLAVDELEWI